MNGNYKYTYISFFRPYLTGIWFSTNLNIREINRIGKVSVPQENLFIYVDFQHTGTQVHAIWHFVNIY